MSDLANFQSWFEPQFSDCLQRDLAAFQTCHSDQALTAYHQTVIDISSKGKRLRPYICSLGYQAGGGRDHVQITAYTVALEYFHTFCLIHDDIIDQAAKRRGVKSVHTAIASQLHTAAQVNAKRLVRVAEGQALLLGDWLLAQACQRFSSAHTSVQQEFYSMIPEVVAGQMIDINTSLFPTASSDQVYKKMYLKTATYSFIRPFQIGLALAGIETPQRQHLARFAEPLGLAFQIQDDYLDLAGEPAVTGKPILSDIKEGQHTIFSQSVLQQPDSTLKREFLEAFGNPDVSDDKLHQLQTALLDLPAIQTALQTMHNYFDLAKQHLADTDLPASVRAELVQLTATIEQRQA